VNRLKVRSCLINGEGAIAPSTVSAHELNRSLNRGDLLGLES
jgi:hypothetical protein